MALTKVEIIAVVIPDDISMIFGNPNIAYLGWFSFRYGTFNGPLRWINWPQSVFFPEAPNATGFTIIPKIGVTFDVTYHNPQSTGLMPAQIGTQAADPLAGIIPPVMAP